MITFIDQHIAQCKEAFTQIDHKGLGSLSTQEVRMAFELLGYKIPQSEIDIIINKIGYKIVDFPHFMQVFSMVKPTFASKDKLIEAFQYLDKENQKSFTKCELEAILKAGGISKGNKEEIKIIVSEADVRQTGYIHYMELVDDIFK
jgi:Ca2+-binding EF-hand superfamily protein